MSIDTPAGQTYEVEAEIRIAAEPGAVWRALTDDVGRWWPHTFEDRPYAIRLEPTIGGRFYEQFDGSGAGALYAHVTYLEPGRILRVSGPMGMRGAVLYVKTYRLEPDGEATIVRTTASMLGALTDAVREGYRSGGEQVLGALRRFVETGDAAR
jgi:uncharacterized protein YndB with AHSA1/START domain